MSDENRGDDFSSYIEDANRDPYADHHKIRYVETFKRLEHYIDPEHRILELGDCSAISLFLKEKGNQTSALTDDLRYAFDLPCERFDLVLSLEVLEHLKDTHSSQGDRGEVTSFNFTGVDNMFQECFRVLKPAGYLCVTTPNACSADAIGRALLEIHPFHEEANVREYTAKELSLFARNNGFDALLVDSFDTWPPVPKADRQKIREFIAAGGYSDALRGNCLFALFQKTSR